MYFSSIKLFHFRIKTQRIKVLQNSFCWKIEHFSHVLTQSSHSDHCFYFFKFFCRLFFFLFCFVFIFIFTGTATSCHQNKFKIQISILGAFLRGIRLNPKEIRLGNTFFFQAMETLMGVCAWVISLWEVAKPAVPSAIFLCNIHFLLSSEP